MRNSVWKLVRSGAVISTVLVLGAVGCSISAESESVSLSPGFDEGQSEPTANPEPRASPEPTQVPAPAPTATAAPTPRATPEPTPTPEPTATVEPDTSPVVVQGEGWVTTQNEVDEMVAFIEETHELDFVGEVAVAVSPDIGAGFAAGFEPIREDPWTLLEALGLTADGIDRDAVNQVRLDRIRGVCCGFEAGATEVVVEIQTTKLATDIVIVHELTHALHTQHQLLGNFAPSFEFPQPAAAAIEGVPSFVARRWLERGSLAEQDLVIPDLPIIPEAFVQLTGSAPARYLNFAYDTGPAFVDAIVASRGLAGLSELIESPPTTTEQVLFPDRYLSGEPAGPVLTPALPASAPADAQIETEGSIGAAILWFLLTDTVGIESAYDHVSGWSGDRFVTYLDGGQLCMAANIAMDTATAATEMAGPLGDSLAASFDRSVIVVTENSLTLTTC